jgi:prophage regulatory protein
MTEKFTPQIPSPAEIRFLRSDQAAEVFGCSTPTLYKLSRSGHVTRPIRAAGARVSGWPEHEIRQLCAARISGASRDDVLALVSAFHELRPSLFSNALSQPNTKRS